MKKRIVLAVVCFFSLAMVLQAARTPAPKNARAYFINLKDGDTVKSPFLVQFGLKNFGVAPALVEWPNTGHFHVIIDDAPYDLNVPLPATTPGAYIHYGKGQTEGMVTLPPGEHTLQIILGDYQHVPHQPPVMSKKIKIQVQ